jgi:hypothetical protein
MATKTKLPTLKEWYNWKIEQRDSLFKVLSEHPELYFAMGEEMELLVSELDHPETSYKLYIFLQQARRH